MATPDVAVFGAFDPVPGECIVVAVVVKPGHTFELEDIVAFLKEQGVAVFNLPEVLHEFPELPRNALEKVRWKRCCGTSWSPLRFSRRRPCASG